LKLAFLSDVFFYWQYRLTTFPAFKPKSWRSGGEGLSERGFVNDVFVAESWPGVSVTGTVFASGLSESFFFFTTKDPAHTLWKSGPCQILSRKKKHVKKSFGQGSKTIV